MAQTRYQLRRVTGKVTVVAEFVHATNPADELAVAMLHRDTCKARRLDPAEHQLRSWNQRTGWIEHERGGPR